jgi:hypothetical protein
MAYSDQLAAIKTHAIAAGATITPKILDVSIGASPPSTRCVRIFYGGEAEPERMGGGLTLTSRLIGERIVVAVYINLSNLSEQEVEAVETELYDFKHELRTRILGDAQLGGNSTDLVMTLVEPDHIVYGNTRYRTLETEIIPEFVEYSISP